MYPGLSVNPIVIWRAVKRGRTFPLRWTLLSTISVVLLTSLITVPNWPWFNRHPLKWLDPLEAEKYPQAAATHRFGFLSGKKMSEDRIIFSWTEWKTLDGHHIVPKSCVQASGGTCASYAISSYILATLRLQEATAGVSHENWTSYVPASEITRIAGEIETGRAGYILNHLTSSSFYLKTIKNGQEKWIDVHEELAKTYKDMSPIRRTGFSTKKICEQIFYNGPVIGVIPICEDFHDPGVQNGTEVYMAKKALLVGKKKYLTHAVLIVGWGVRDGVDYFKYLNSYGETWGDKGYGKVAIAALTECYAFVLTGEGVERVEDEEIPVETQDRRKLLKTDGCSS
ncbi:hypothetical protein Tsubulata_038165 [Turnera subulata]|uniref:Signal peptidase complex subunit 1 n=1 Tax=Turnera subulata TaxID=218843 RepID=A0A9Q0GHG6_9ROSI|nr:hypothetical protein Tsubulata_038165 [Turnera subulata]